MPTNATSNEKAAMLWPYGKVNLSNDIAILTKSGIASGVRCRLKVFSKKYSYQEKLGQTTPKITSYVPLRVNLFNNHRMAIGVISFRDGINCYSRDNKSVFERKFIHLHVHREYGLICLSWWPSI